jgi:hypothetical protein
MTGNAALAIATLGPQVTAAPPQIGADAQAQPARAAPTPAGRANPAIAARITNPAEPQTRTPDAPAAAPVTRAALPPASAQPAAPAHSGAAEARPAADAPPAPAGNPAATMIPAMASATLSILATPAIAAPAPVETPTDFATLVDSIARARSESGDAAANPVGVTLSHSDFGRVSMQFTPHEQGLSVTMRSADPGFAPAVAAAAASSGSGDAGGNARSHTDQPAPQAPGTDTLARGSGSGAEQNQRGDTAHQGARQGQTGKPATANRGGSDADDTTGIFA